MKFPATVADLTTYINAYLAVHKPAEQPQTEAQARWFVAMTATSVAICTYNQTDSAQLLLDGAAPLNINNWLLEQNPPLTKLPPHRREAWMAKYGEVHGQLDAWIDIHYNIPFTDPVDKQ